MESREAGKIFEALASEVRLDAFRLLVRYAPDGLVAGDIARLLKLPATNLSFHLKGLVQSGLVTVEREGRFQRYRASIPLMLEIIAYLTAECCSGKPECCRKLREASGIAPEFFKAP
ncbi:helix-turn-helix domain-containing protein [uncultured Mailhella sp.]|uniref:ArsR/SmtB family transcription factor n=1 Tax=uncultured Mailhella sp. TaxID=1981031 RepID=UPI002620F4E4|nr:helix-turn-helix domain-containing protein [uncultured Mailhella sp.]